MKHLTVDEIIEFVSMTELNSETVKLAAYVNEHIRECGKCLELVQAFQLIYDEFEMMSSDEEFKNYIINEVLNGNTENASSEAIQSAFDESDGYK